MKTHMIIYSLSCMILTVVSSFSSLSSSFFSSSFCLGYFWISTFDYFLFSPEIYFSVDREKKGLIFSDYINCERQVEKRERERGGEGKKVKRINSLSVWNNKYYFPLLQRDKVTDCATPNARNHFFHFCHKNVLLFIALEFPFFWLCFFIQVACKL